MTMSLADKSGSTSGIKLMKKKTEAAKRDGVSAEDYVNGTCDLDEYLRERECSAGRLFCQLGHMN